jgi:hypothetical protein
MNRRWFVKMAPAYTAAAAASVVIHEPGKTDVNLELSVLKVQSGDCVVLSSQSPISRETSERIKTVIEGVFPDGVTALVMDGGIKIDGVLRS